MRRKAVSAEDVRRALDVAKQPDPDQAALGSAVRITAQAIAERHPGKTVEIRIPPRCSPGARPKQNDLLQLRILSQLSQCFADLRRLQPRTERAPLPVGGGRESHRNRLGGLAPVAASGTAPCS